MAASVRSGAGPYPDARGISFYLSNSRRMAQWLGHHRQAGMDSRNFSRYSAGLLIRALRIIRQRQASSRFVWPHVHLLLGLPGRRIPLPLFSSVWESAYRPAVGLD